MGLVFPVGWVSPNTRRSFGVMYFTEPLPNFLASAISFGSSRTSAESASAWAAAAR